MAAREIEAPLLVRDKLASLFLRPHPSMPGLQGCWAHHTVMAGSQALCTGYTSRELALL